MSSRPEATAPDSLPEIAAFLRGVYRVPPDSPNFNSDLLAWKYYQAGPEWEGSRSFVLRKKDHAIVAHGSVWPVRLATPTADVKAVRVLDWASSAPGMGVALMNQMSKIADVILGVGGSEDTLRVLPAMGFKHYGTARIYARVLRPWGQFRTRKFDGARALGRLMRNTQWSHAPLASGAGWAYSPSMPSAFDGGAEDYPASRHSAEFLEFMLRCPGATVSYFALSQNGSPQGYFVLSRAGGQCRLADLRIRSAKSEDLIGAYATAVRAAARDRESCELATYATVPLDCAALEANGFRMRGEMPVLALDKKNLLGDAPHLHLGMLDDDSGYLNNPEDPYCT